MLHKIEWYDIKSLKIPELKKFQKKYPKYITWVGICGLTKKICKVTKEIIEVMIVKDFYLTGNECEEKNRCINFSCKYNEKAKIKKEV